MADVTTPSAGSRPRPESRMSATVHDMRLASTEVLLGTAAEVLVDVSSGSSVFDPNIEEKIPKFSDREISAGRILGRGGFCVVHEIEKIRTGRSDSSRSLGSKTRRSFFGLCGGSAVDDTTDTSVRSFNTSDNMSQDGLRMDCDDLKFSRDYVAARSKKTRSDGGRYVVKSVSKDIGKLNYMKANVDIACEAKFLAVLDHENIIEMVGTSRTSPCNENYFIILERVTQTLSSRIKTWMDAERLSKGVTGFFTGGNKREQELYRGRIKVSYDIANALGYLHSKNIIFRDLKPDNIGFSRTGILKLFDFGLAKELRDKDLRSDGTYNHLTGTTGALRYMAPEVGLGRPYNLSADVYSWSMIMWFILALEPPFGFYTESMIQDRVFKRGSRPAVFKRWNGSIGEAMRNSWDRDLNSRPTARQIRVLLQQELVDCDGGTVSSQ